MGHRRERSTEGQRRRLVEELGEIGLCLDGTEPWHALVVEELDYALRPAVHERRVPSFGAFIGPTVSSWAWEESTALTIERRPIAVDRSTHSARRFADGVSSWLIRHLDGRDEWAVFDRPAGSERDLVVLAQAFGAVVVQRHPSDIVRLAGDFGVYRWDGMHWHHEPQIATWFDRIPLGEGDDRMVLAKMLAFAVHDLGARNIGATLVYRASAELPGSYQSRLPTPPPLHIRRPADLAPLRHVLGQLDGAALFDAKGVMTEIGVRLVPSAQAETDIDGFKGMRHTSARRFSFDDPGATVIVVSEDGPVTVLRAGEKLASSAPVLVDPGDLIDPDPAELDEADDASDVADVADLDGVAVP